MSRMAFSVVASASATAARGGVSGSFLLLQHPNQLTRDTSIANHHITPPIHLLDLGKRVGNVLRLGNVKGEYEQPILAKLGGEVIQYRGLA